METDRKQALERLVYTLNAVINKKNKIVIPPYQKAISELQEKLNILINSVLKFRESKSTKTIVENAWRDLINFYYSQDFYRYINNFASLSGLLAPKNNYYQKIFNKFLISRLSVDEICKSGQYASDDFLYNLGIMRTHLEAMQECDKNMTQDVIRYL